MTTEHETPTFDFRAGPPMDPPTARDVVTFKCEDSLWRMLSGHTRTWDFRRVEAGDDRLRRLLAFVPGGAPVERAVRFVNKASGEGLVLRYLGWEVAAWAPGWVFLLLGDVLAREPGPAAAA